MSYENRFVTAFLKKIAGAGIPEQFARSHLRRATWKCLWAILSAPMVVEAIIQELKREQLEEEIATRQWLASQLPPSLRGAVPLETHETYKKRNTKKDRFGNREG